jgi:hypothetical protein
MKAPQKKTADCFKGFEYRDSNLDTLLPKVQEAQECEVSVLTLTEEMTFGEMAQHFFGSSSIEEIKKHTLTLPIVENMLEELTGYLNFFFVENKDGGVSVGYVFRRDVVRPWRVSVYELAYVRRWYSGLRLLVCNLGTDLESRIATIEAVLKYHNLTGENI